MADPTPQATKDTFTLPPTRADKRIVVLPVDMQDMSFEGRTGGGDAMQGLLGTNVARQLSGFLGGGSSVFSGLAKLAQGRISSPQNYTKAPGKRTITGADFQQLRVSPKALTAAGLTDFIYIRLRGRGADGGDLTWRFPINPDTIQVNRQVVDAESLSRAGLQTGIWGDLIDISLSGATAGQYFAGTLVDAAAEYSRSTSAMAELVALYENNGTWFEGEVTGNAAGAAGYTRKQIQLQADVTLAFGNFMWDGCFTEMSLDDSADTPFYNKFTLGFMAWRERFRSDSPWRNSISDAQRPYLGHAWELYDPAQRRKAQGLTGLDKAAANPISMIAPVANAGPAPLPATPAPTPSVFSNLLPSMLQDPVSLASSWMPKFGGP